MNTKEFCTEFKKILGQYRSKRMKRRQGVPSGNKSMCHHLIGIFYMNSEIYLKVRVSELKKLFGNDYEYLYFLCYKVYKRFTRRFRKNCRRSGFANLDKTYTSVSQCIGMLNQLLQKVFIKNRMTLEFFFYETVVLSLEISIRRKIYRKNHEIICKKTKNLS